MEAEHNKLVVWPRQIVAIFPSSSAHMHATTALKNSRYDQDRRGGPDLNLAAVAA
jgi:hypothetical protein